MLCFPPAFHFTCPIIADRIVDLASGSFSQRGPTGIGHLHTFCDTAIVASHLYNGDLSKGGVEPSMSSIPTRGRAIAAQPMHLQFFFFLFPSRTMPLPPALLARLKKRGIVAGDAGATKVVATPTPAAEPVVAAAAEPVSTHTGELIIIPLSLAFRQVSPDTVGVEAE